MSIELADIFHMFDYQLKNLNKQKSKVVNAIKKCRTSALGGHRVICKSCDYQTQAYNSCRNRHCPKCGFLVRSKWIEKRSNELFDCQYFHAVFTLPSQLRLLVKDNKKLLYDLLFKTSSETIKEVAKNPQHLGADVGFIGVLHTWTQDLREHPHVHYLIPGGGLKNGKWIHCHQDYLLPREVLSKVYRGKVIEALESLYHNDKLKFSKDLDYLSFFPNFKEFLFTLAGKDFVIYCKKPFAGPKQVINYLGQYTHRIAISNYRLIKIEENKIFFKVRDKKNPGTSKIISLTTNEFMRRFLTHVLPKGFVRIRHFGILGNRAKNLNVSLIQTLQGIKEKLEEQQELIWSELLKMLTGIDVFQCPKCLKIALERIAPVSSLLNSS